MLFDNHFLDFLRGNSATTKGTAYVVYEDIFDAKNACEHLSGFNVCNRYLVVLYYQPHKVNIAPHSGWGGVMKLFSLQAFKKMNKELKKEQIEILKTKYGIDLEAETK